MGQVFGFGGMPFCLIGDFKENQPSRRDVFLKIRPYPIRDTVCRAIVNQYDLTIMIDMAQVAVQCLLQLP